jgi:nitrite transporter NirC
MPVPIAEALGAQEDAAQIKAQQAKLSPLKYLTLSALAGAYVGVAVVLLVLVSASFLAQNSPSTKLIQGVVFGIALTLVVFAGAELFTGNVMIMLQGLMARRVKVADVLLIWIGSLIGNLVGSVLFAAMVGASGVINAGAPKGKLTIFATALAGIVKTKAGLSGAQLFWRSVLCNMLVCLALWMAQRTKSDAAKLICLWWALLAFVVSGFEHSVANMTVFSLGIFTHLPQATWGAMARNLMWTVPGNIVGGGLLVGIAYGYVGNAKTLSSALPTPPDYGATTSPSAVAAERVEEVAYQRAVSGHEVLSGAPDRYAPAGGSGAADAAEGAGSPARPLPANRSMPPPPRQMPNGAYEYRRPLP